MNQMLLNNYKLGMNNKQQQETLLAGKHQNIAYIFQIMSCLFFVSSFIYPNEHKINAIETSFIRSVFCLFANYIVLKYKQETFIFDYKQKIMALKFHFRAFFLTISMPAIPLAMFYLPMPLVQSINCSLIIFIPLFDYWLNGIQMSNKGRISVFLGIVGVVSIANSKLIMKWWNPQYQFKTSFQNYVSTDSVTTILVSMFLCLIIFIFSYASVLTKEFKKKFSVFQLNFYFNALTVMLSAIAYPYIPTQQRLDTQTYIGLFFFTGLPFFLAQSFYYQSIMMSSKVGYVMILNTCNILFSYIYSSIAYHQSFNIFSIFGSLMIIVAAILIAISK